jgi:hexosaminidase
MKANRRVLWTSLLLIAATVVHAQTSPAPSVNVVPRPVTVRPLAGTFMLTDATRILAADNESRRIAVLFNDFLLNQHGFHLHITATRPKGENYISFNRAGSEGLREEGYRLVIGPESVRVTGRAAGLFYGMQTLTQLLPLNVKPAIVLPALEITDYPRFGYRGLLLDVGRHFFTVTYLKKYLDLAAQYKINTFHWHLTDDQGWRIEIKKYPRLTAVVPQPSDTPIGQNSLYANDGTPYAPYYTQEQIKDIVAYAQARFITVIPEIEMPGHSGAAVAAYPELACRQGIADNVLCPKEETFTFMQNVLNEVIALFPGPYVHIGGDEVQKDGWRQSAEAQAIMKREGLKNEDELQSYFVRRIERVLTSKGKRMIGWDEILEGGLAPNAIVMSWRGESGGVEAVRARHRAIMTPTDYCYLDYNQGDPKREPPNIGGFLPLEKVYGYNPIPKELQGEEQKYILGAQANVWTEYISTPEYLEYMMFPRLLALSEVLWSPLEGKDYEDFQRRLLYQFGRLDKQDVHYRIPEPDGLKDFYTATDDHAVIELSPPIPGSQIYYTLDGSAPTDQSARYQLPFQVPLQADKKTILNLIVVTPAGQRSVVYGATLLRQSYREPVSYDAGQPGLAFVLFNGTFTTVQDIEKGVQATTGNTSSFDLQQFGREVNYGITFNGYLRIQSDGFYEFAVESDDGSVLQIDDEVVVDNDGNHGSRKVSGHIPLRRGFHKVKLGYFQSEGGASLRISWAAPGGELKPLDGSALYH